MEKRFLSADKAEIRAIEEKDSLPVVAGYFVRFGELSDNLTGFREIVEKGFFAEALRSCDMVDLLNHDPNEIMGRQSAYGDEGKLIVWEDDTGLAYRLTPPNTQYVRDKFLTPIRLGLLQGNSFGFSTKPEGYNLKPDSKIANAWIRTLLPNGCSEILEGSQVVYPAYSGSNIELRSADTMEAMEQIKQAGIRLDRDLETQILDGEYEDFFINQVKKGLGK